MPFAELENSARECDCCSAIFQGCCGLMNKYGLHQSEVTSVELFLGYQLEVEVFDRDCTKLITLETRNGQQFVVEFFVPDGKCISRTACHVC